MYAVDSNKRYNVTIQQEGKYLNEMASHKQVEILVLDRHFIQIRDSKGKEHIYTGTIGIYADEV